MDRLMGILAVGLAVTSTGTVRAQEEQPFGLVPPSWFEESAEISNSLEDPSRPHPELP